MVPGSSYRHPSKLKYLFLGISLIWMNSCVKEEFDSKKLDTSIQTEAGIALPIGYSHVSIDRYYSGIDSSQEVIITDDGFITLSYKKDVYSIQLLGFEEIPVVPAPGIVTNNSGSPLNLLLVNTIVDTFLLPVIPAIPGIHIDSFRVLSGSLSSVETKIRNITGGITYTFTGIKKENSPPKLYGHQIGKSDIDNGFDSTQTWILQHDEFGNGLLECIVKLNIDKTTGTVNVDEQLISFLLSFTNLKFHTLYGKFSGLPLEIPSMELSLGIFNQFVQGHFSFHNPELKILFENSFGIPFSLYFHELQGISSNGNSLLLSGEGIPTQLNSKIINYPSLLQQGKPVPDSIVWNSSNSNLSQLLDMNPNQFHVGVTTAATETHYPPSHFIRYDSRFNLSTAVTLPLWGKAEFLILQDTLAFDYLSTIQKPPEEIEQITTRISFTTQFPFEISPQVYLVDEFMQVIDSLFDGNQIVKGASDLNGDGISDPTHHDPIDITLNRNTIDRLPDVRYLITRGSIRTSGYPDKDVKFYSFYFLDYSFGLLVKLRISPSQP